MNKQQILDNSYIIYDIPELQNLNINKIKEEINFQEMYSQGAPVPRLISIQGKIENGLKPLYRHPADTQPELTEMTNTVKKICDILSQKLNQKFNHVLIQLYRNGNDNISEHADKTLDIEKNTNIVNYSLGATRTMKLRKKKSNDLCEQREIHKVRLLHNSIFVLGWNDNCNWLHSINQDKRTDNIKQFDELSFNGERISFTFRTIATFVDDSNNIFGQGAPKNKDYTTDDTLEMLYAFSKENHEINFDWNKYYSNGFNAINFTTCNKN
jgi:alkylated DNA repair dioxygenase AlkB